MVLPYFPLRRKPPNYKNLIFSLFLTSFSFNELLLNTNIYMLQPTIPSIFPQFPAASLLARHVYDQEITVPEMMKTCKKEQLVPVLQNLL